MNLIELMETWKLKTENRQKSNIDFLYEIMEAANVDERVNRETLALEIINECGTMTPRYMKTDVFVIFAVNFFKVHEREYVRDLDALETQYAALFDYEILKTNERTTNAVNGSTKTNNVEEQGESENTRTDNLNELIEDGDTTFTHSVSADNESGYSGRSQDTTHDEPRERTNTGTQTNEEEHSKTTNATQNTEETRDFAESGTRTESGRKRPAQELLFSEFEANRLNIYRNIALDFGDTMMLSVC